MSAIVTTVLLVGYLAVLAWLGIAGMRKTQSLSGFAIGNRDMHPALVGIAMASSIASTATFVINPGFVYTDGLSAFLHYGVAAQAGVIFGLLAVCKGFRRHGDQNASLTIPDWIRARYGNRTFALFFAIINLLSIAFIVLILFGCALLVTTLTGMSHVPALIAVTVVVFGYVMQAGAATLYHIPPFVFFVPYDHANTFDDFDIRLTIDDGEEVRQVSSISSEMSDWISVLVPAGAELTAEVHLASTWRTSLRDEEPNYRLFVVGGTQHWTSFKTKGDHQATPGIVD